MNIAQLKKLLGLMASLSFATIISLQATSRVIHTAKSTGSTEIKQEKSAPFEQEEWKTNAKNINTLIAIDNPLNRIKAMYIAKIKAARFLIHQKTRAANIIPEQTIEQRTATLLSSVAEFLPKIKIFKKLILPLIKISLNRAPTDAEKELDPDMQKHLTFNDSLFKKALASTEEINSFIKTHIKNEEDFTKLCDEFHRVFSDLLNHAFTDLTHKFEKTMEEDRKRKLENRDNVEEKPKTVTPTA